MIPPPPLYRWGNWGSEHLLLHIPGSRNHDLFYIPVYLQGLAWSWHTVGSQQLIMKSIITRHRHQWAMAKPGHPSSSALPELLFPNTAEAFRASLIAQLVKNPPAMQKSLIPGSGRSTGDRIGYPFQYSWTSLVAQLVKNPPAMQETWVWSLGWEDPLEKGKATHSNILAWRNPWTV